MAGSGLDPTLSALVERLPGPLASPGARAALLRLAAAVPAASGGIGFECRLGGDPCSPVDLSVRLAKADGSAAMAARVQPRDAIGELCRRWCSAPQDNGLFDVLWVELDAAQPGTAIPSLLFFGAPARPWPVDQALAGMQSTFAQVVGVPLASDLNDHLRRVLERLSPHGALRHMGVSLGRGGGFVRLCHAMAAEAVPAVLGGLGLSGRAGDMGNALRRYADGLGDVVLHLDVGKDVGPRLGIELFPATVRQRRDLLGLLAADGLCTETKRQALLAWPEVPSELLRPGAGARYSRDIPENPSRRGDGVVLRSLHHVKLVFDPGGLATAKAYLYAGRLWPIGDVAA